MKHLQNISIRVIPHKDQRYDTVGDYQKLGNVTSITISKSMADYEFLVTLHELIELYLITRKGISIKDIDNFDMQFEEMRLNYPHIVGDKEPGDDENAPYFFAHKIATEFERKMAEYLNIDWNKYDQVINKM